MFRSETTFIVAFLPDIHYGLFFVHASRFNCGYSSRYIVFSNNCPDDDVHSAGIDMWESVFSDTVTCAECSPCFWSSLGRSAISLPQGTGHSWFWLVARCCCWKGRATLLPYYFGCLQMKMFCDMIIYSFPLSLCFQTIVNTKRTKHSICYFYSKFYLKNIGFNFILFCCYATFLHYLCFVIYLYFLWRVSS